MNQKKEIKDLEFRYEILEERFNRLREEYENLRQLVKEHIVSEHEVYKRIQEAKTK